MLENLPDIVTAKDLWNGGIFGRAKSQEFMRRKDLPIVHIGTRRSFITKDNLIKVLNEGGEF